MTKDFADFLGISYPMKKAIPLTCGIEKFKGMGMVAEMTGAQAKINEIIDFLDKLVNKI